MPDDTITDVTPAVVDHPLTGWTPFGDNVRALIFGHMVRRAMPVMREYMSDLYHDAHWLDAFVNGPTEFEWLIRPSGTNIADTARIGVRIGPGDGAEFYRVRVYGAESPRPVPQGELHPTVAERAANGGDVYWHVEFTRVPLSEVDR